MLGRVSSAGLKATGIASTPAGAPVTRLSRQKKKKKKKKKGFPPPSARTTLFQAVFRGSLFRRVSASGKRARGAGDAGGTGRIPFQARNGFPSSRISGFRYGRIRAKARPGRETLPAVIASEGNMEKTGSGYGPLLVLLGALCFSTTGTVQALAPAGATPYVIGALRMLGGGLALLLWCAWKGTLPQKGWWPLRYVLPGMLALLGFQFLFFKGVMAAGVAVGTVVAIGFSPIVVAVLGFALLRERPPLLWYPATALALTGLVLLNTGNAGYTDLSSILLPLGAGFSYACYFVSSKPLVRHNPPETVMMVLCLGSGICMLPVFWLYPTAWLASGTGVLVALHLGVITTAMAFSLTLAGLKVTPAATASTLSLGEPLGAACLGLFFLNETLTFSAGVGIALIFLSVLLLVAFDRR